MNAINQKGASPTNAFNLQVIVNFCHTVLRADDDLLQQAITQYQQALLAQRSR